MLQFGAADAWDALIYPTQTDGNAVQWMQQQFSNISSTLTEAGRSFIDYGRKAFDHYNGAEALRFARSVMSKAVNQENSTYIVPLFEQAALQNASVTMQRWVMANPTIRTLYHGQKCDGYSDTYHDVCPGMIGEDHYDYRRVMDGVFRADPEIDWKCVTYFEDLVKGDKHLDHDEQVAILQTWNSMDLLMALKIDPTSKEGGSL